MRVQLQPGARGNSRGWEVMQLDAPDLNDGDIGETSETLRCHTQPGK